MSLRKKFGLVTSRLEKAVSNKTKVWISILFGVIGPVGVDSIVTLIYGSPGGWIKAIALVIELILPSVVIYLLWNEIGRLHNSALIDPLSGLYNRRGGDSILFAQLSNIFRQRRNRKHIAVAVAFIDIDYFKKINDTFGHAVGDKVIQELSRILRNVFPRSTDVCIRQGGDEFVVILPQTHATATKIKMDELVRLVSESSIVTGPHVTLSVGIASGYVSRDEALWHEELATIFTRADQALYFVKKNGRNDIKILREAASNLILE